MIMDLRSLRVMSKCCNVSSHEMQLCAPGMRIHLLIAKSLLMISCS